ncbi:MAG: twin-arginine translocase TatA/TatE family subunit [Planctomycetes bacterium]|nr:twin-arginine translocase TatA/TatE family subunit [Planctomycetota bacterium]MCC8116568.1 twin-arginine translocase TatA/TatE family subunit [Planctomycetota bacterium]MCD7897910.1 twin-arginine translocase TatA/TatE family subunit [Planctomycetaceae bacterium]
MESLPVAFASMPGTVEWVVIGLVALLLFGKRLPGVARSVGQALTEFKSGLSGDGEKKTAPAVEVERTKPDI